MMKALLIIYRQPGDCKKILLSFSGYSVFPRHCTYWETNVYAGSFCTSNLSSGTALQHDSVIHKVGWKHLMMNILPGCSPLCLIFFHLQWSCLKSILQITRVSVASLFPLDHLLMLTSWSGEIMVQANAIFVCIMFGAWIWKIGLI